MSVKISYSSLPSKVGYVTPKAIIFYNNQNSNADQNTVSETNKEFVFKKASSLMLYLQIKHNNYLPNVYTELPPSEVDPWTTEQLM